MDLLSQSTDCQVDVSGSVSPLPEKLLEMQRFGLHYISTVLETLGIRPGNLYFNKPSK